MTKDFAIIMALLQRVKENQERAIVVQEKYLELQAELEKQKIITVDKKENGSFLDENAVITKETQIIIEALNKLLDD